MRILLALMAVAMFLTGCGDSETMLKNKAARIHEAAWTVDTHDDTPLVLHRPGFDFGKRNDPYQSHSKIDLPRIREGGMDGLWFAVFIGQGARTPEGNEKARERAFKIIQDIYDLVEEYSDDLVVATKADDLKKIAKKGKHAIYLGMENGYPLGNDLDMLDLYYEKGIRYVTLVHTVNNDICDSSTDSTEHGGLSAFGRNVVARMNDLGIMVDVSHASDEGFYDMLEESSAPVIASHSSARVLCDNPRNITDEMLLALKANGGVIQLCILSAYVKTPQPNPENDAPKLASVKDAVDHIDHIVKLIGIDHVGIGTDFDGGGGLEDCYDVSQVGNITLELVRRGYSSREIKKIWGGNLTRVFAEVEAAASAPAESI